MRIVVKIGSSSLVDAAGRVNHAGIATLVADIASAHEAGHRIVVVSSGAIATGLGLLGHTERPSELPALQAASAVGQGALFAVWAREFQSSDVHAAQVLLTMHDASHRASWVNARNTIEQLLGWNVIPIVNENDTTATDEITFGDNDTLAAQVAVAVEADALLLLTDTDGLYTEHPSHPDAQLIERVDDHSLLRRIDTATPGSHWGSGGMRSKVIAAEMASAGGTTTFIARSSTQDVVSSIASGGHIGTRVAPDRRQGTSFKLWLRYAKQTRGAVHVDDGAWTAIVERGASLLPVGIQSIDGEFIAGDAVSVHCASRGGEFARGIVGYGSGELRMGLTDRARLRGVGEAIHRDQLVVFGSSTEA